MNRIQGRKDLFLRDTPEKSSVSKSWEVFCTLLLFIVSTTAKQFLCFNAIHNGNGDVNAGLLSVASFCWLCLASISHACRGVLL